MTRFSQYRIMWAIVLFDLPTETKEERKAASDFRKMLLKDGFMMFQFSAYVRHCSSDENAEVHTQRVRNWLPEKGYVSVFKMTDKQFGSIQLFYGQTRKKANKTPEQLMLF